MATTMFHLRFGSLRKEVTLLLSVSIPSYSKRRQNLLENRRKNWKAGLVFLVEGECYEK